MYYNPVLFQSVNKICFKLRSVRTMLSMDSLIAMLFVLSCRLIMKVCTDHAINGFTHHGVMCIVLQASWRSVRTTLSMDSLIALLCVLSCRLIMNLCTGRDIHGFTHCVVMCLVLQTYYKGLYGPRYQWIHSAYCYVYCPTGLLWRSVRTTLSMDSFVVLFCVLSYRLIIKVYVPCYQ